MFLTFSFKLFFGHLSYNTILLFGNLSVSQLYRKTEIPVLFLNVCAKSSLNQETGAQIISRRLFSSVFLVFMKIAQK